MLNFHDIEIERRKVEAEMLVAATMRKLGAISGELTFSQACRIYGSWFRGAVEQHHILPSRVGRGTRCTKWFSIESILALKAEELKTAGIILTKNGKN